ncbi:MAG TPA: aminotransferase class I/II-fold pyridoxal phosphate-dependent enzyme [Anaerolineales bacterium]|nr:aminotransferase class I/II-fold pyridoxal phosphate-dependent enzyme [Anaerolineales bacterium]
MSVAFSPKIARRVHAIKPSGLRKFFDIIASRPEIISLGIGQPDFATPEVIRQAGIEAIATGDIGYTANPGLLELREAIAIHLARRYGVHYDPQQEIVLTVGVSEGLFLALAALLDPGDEVLLPTPCFVAYPAMITLAGGVPVEVPLRAEDDFQPNIEALAQHLSPRTKAILINYPHNPTGAAARREAMEALTRFAEEHDLVVISDEIYDQLVYDTEHICFPALEGAWPRTVLLGGFSKDYAMTGWRLGYAAAPAPILQALLRIHQHLIMAAPAIAQYAALEALQNPRAADAVAAMRAEYDRRRRLIVDGLNAMGLTTREPQGAFYAFAEVRGTGLDDEAFAWRLLEEEEVAVVPGSAFGPGGEGFIRCSYATAYEKIEAALERMARFVQRLRVH